jgi:glycosyltransferase involved in cell wall biosynthesis
MSSISVIITSYNDEEYIGEAIESVLNQTLLPEEVLLLDDESTDHTREIIREYALDYPDLIRPRFHESNLGVSKNRNYGLDVAEGDYITFLDSDNIFRPEKLEAEYSLLAENPKAGIAFSDFYYTAPDGEILRQWCENHEPPTGDVHEAILTRDWPSGTLFSHPMIKRSLFSTAGRYDEELDLYEDWDIFIRLTESTDVVYTSQPLVEYRQVDGSLSSQSSAVEIFESFNHILQKHIQEQSKPEVKDKIQTLLHEQKAEMHYEQGERVAAIQSYLKAVKTDSSIINKGSLKYILPRSVFRPIRRVYQSLRY